ncbi:unnamed protein product [Ectocarpus sp. 4 AP-2014]
MPHLSKLFLVSIQQATDITGRERRNCPPGRACNDDTERHRHRRACGRPQVGLHLKLV